MQLDMKNAFCQRSNGDPRLILGKGYRLVVMGGYGRTDPLLNKPFYPYGHSVLLGAGWKKSQVDKAPYFKAGDNGVTCWVRLLPKTPVSFDAYAELTFDDVEAQKREEEEEYRQKVGSLQFAATRMRPEIAFACSKLGSGLSVRSDQHWCEVDRCLAYLADTRDTALEFGGGPESLELTGYVDVDDASDKQNRTSVGGYVFQGGTPTSFLFAEFKLLDAGKPTILRVDNKSEITVAEGLGLMGNLKHMERRYARLQHMVRRGKFRLKYIPTTEQPADFLTKALHSPAFNQCSVAIGQVCLADVGNGDDDVQP
ncbi:unnamed protein product [Closterium sp. NIES-53]